MKLATIILLITLGRDAPIRDQLPPMWHLSDADQQLIDDIMLSPQGSKLWEGVHPLRKARIRAQQRYMDRWLARALGSYE